MLSWLFSNPLAPGTPAPDFTVSDEEGSTVRLGALRGRNIVLIFYPGDGTPVCTKQLCEFRDAWRAAEESNTVVFGVNPRSEASHASFRAKHRFPFPLLVDKGQRLAALYRANGLVVKRTVYLIGPDGVIRYAKRGKPAPAEVLAHAVRA
jgi:peroxiredoxin Q/BCP